MVKWIFGRISGFQSIKTDIDSNCRIPIVAGVGRLLCRVRNSRGKRYSAKHSSIVVLQIGWWGY